MCERENGRRYKMPTDTQYEPTEAEVLQAVERLKKQREKRGDYQKKRNDLMKTDPETAAKMVEARSKYNKGEKAIARRKEYYSQHKDKIKESHQKYHEKQKALLAKAKKMGLV
jgi:chromosome segregation ATPase